MKKAPKVLLFTLVILALFLSVSNGIFAKAARNSIEIGVFNFYDGLTAENLREFENSSGRHVYTALIYQELTAADFVRFPETQLNEAILFHEPFDTNTIPMTTWEPKMALDSIHQGSYDQEITEYANAVVNWDHPLRIRFAHEMIQDDNLATPGWYPWQDQPDDYKAAFQHIVTIFENQGANQVEFVWCPNHYPADFDTISKYYPGEDYVDWLCMDGYNWTNQDNTPNQYPDWQSFDQIFSPIYTVFQNNAAFFGEKPIMIGEFASCEASEYDLGQSKEAWIMDTMMRIKHDDYDRIKAFYWFNADKSHIPDSYECNWRIDSSPANEIAFQNALADPIFISHLNVEHSVFIPMINRQIDGRGLDGRDLQILSWYSLE